MAILTGTTGNDTLSGIGADTMTGLTGNDTYIVDNVGDAIVEALGEGTDTAQTSVTYTLASNVENLILTGAANIDGTGNTLENRLTGNSGNNILDGGAGVDILVGGAGNDTYIVDTASDVISDTSGTDTVIAAASYTLGLGLENLTLSGAGNINATGNTTNNTLTGNAGNNTLSGGFGADIMVGGVGNDTYMVDNASDVITENAAEGTDTAQASVTYTLSANIENLTLSGAFALNGTGNSGDNTLTGNSSSNTLTGGAGNDTLDGGVGMDTLIGGLGNDTYIVDHLYDKVTENAAEGTDSVQASVTYTLSANVEDLTLTGSSHLNGTGNASDNTITGNSGNNTLDGKAGADTLVGGAGDDTYIIDNAGDTITENAAEGTDIAQSSATYTLSANVENLTLTGSAVINGTGNTGNNTLTGNSAANILTGGTGNDTYIVGLGDSVVELVGEGTDTVSSALSYTLNTAGGANVENLTLTGYYAINGIGNALDNTLTGNGSANVLTGLGGNDTYIVGYWDTVVEAAASGTDTVSTNISRGTLEANVENLTLTGTAAINGTGNTLDNTLTGNAAANTLDGGTGADTLIGGAGNDTYIVDNTLDIITENASEGTDTVKASASYTLATEVENLILTGIASINGTGNASNNTITGNFGNNVIDGGAGADTMIGGFGNDTYVVDDAGDIVTDTYGTDSVLASVNYTLGTGIENLTLTGVTDLTGTGNISNNTLTGNGGNNTLDGGLGNDTLIGGAGNDTYVLNSTSDTVVENVGEGTDTVQSSVSHALSTNVENLTLMGTASLTGTGNALDNTIIGNTGNNSLVGNDGNDTLKGGEGIDVIHGNNGNDTIYGQGGVDILWGDAAADTFVFEAGTAYSATDTIKDFSIAQNDKLDISDLLTAYDSLTDNLTDFVKISDANTASVLQVDRDGTATAYGWTTVAILSDVTGLTDEDALAFSGNLIV